MSPSAGATRTSVSPSRGTSSPSLAHSPSGVEVAHTNYPSPRSTRRAAAPTKGRVGARGCDSPPLYQLALLYLTLTFSFPVLLPALLNNHTPLLWLLPPLSPCWLFFSNCYFPLLFHCCTPHLLILLWRVNGRSQVLFVCVSISVLLLISFSLTFNASFSLCLVSSLCFVLSDFSILFLI